MDGTYYLHTNGKLIFKPDNYEYSESPRAPGSFVRHVWPVDFSDRADGWIMLIEAYAMGANKEQITQLAKKWDMDLNDLAEFLGRRTCSEELSTNVKLFMRDVLQETPEALVEILKQKAILASCTSEGLAQ